MDWTPSPVRFAFRLPPTLLLRAEPGLWADAPRDVTLQVAGDGAVEIRCTNGSERYARTRVLHTAAGFLRSIDQDVPPLSISAVLTPANGERPIRHMITIGACVSIARTNEAPAVFGGTQRAALPRARTRERTATAA